MAEYLSPGVYVEEVDSSPRAIEGVGTSTAGFVGMAAKGGLVGAPLLVTNFANFVEQFGGHLSEYTHSGYRFLAYSVEQFFVNGGTRCYVSRVAPEDATSASVTAENFLFTATSEGKWGNRITVSFAASNKKRMNLIALEGKQTYKAKNVDGFYEGDSVIVGTEYNRIVSILNNSVTFEKEWAIDPVDTNVVPKTFVFGAEIDMIIRADSDGEAYNNVSLNKLAPNYIVKKLSSSKFVKIEAVDNKESLNPLLEVLADDKSGTVMLKGGSDGTMSKVTAETFIGVDGGPGKRTGIQSFIENNIVSIIAVPGVTIPEVVVSLVAHCENLKNRVAVIDVPEELTKIDDIIAYRNMIDSTFAAMYHPWVQVFDRATKKPGFVPPSGTVMGIYSRTDITRGVHKAPANEIVNGATGLSINYTVSEQDILNPAGINLIRAIPGQGIRVWGARTASSNTNFKYVNVRRLFIFVEQSIKSATNWVVFEPNNESLWGRVQVTISSFLQNIFRAGMLSGTSEAEAFFVDIGPNTMSKDDILNGRLICQIGIAPSRPAEFVIFRISQFTAESGGEAPAAE